MTRLSFSLGFAALLAVTTGEAAELPESIKQAGALRLTVNSTYAPMEYRDPSTNQLVGLDIDLANELAKRLGVKIIWSETPFAELIPSLQTKRADFIISGISDRSSRREDTWNELYQRWNGRGDGRIGLAMSPHATDTCGEDLLRACAARARELDVPITTHLAQSQAEVATIGGRHGGRTPAEYLDWLGLLAPDLMAAHCIASTDNDLKLMAARGATVLNCPRVFARSGVTAAFGRFAEHGVRTVVGTDGYNMDLLGELNAASMISKIASARADVANAPELIESVTATAAAVIKRPDLGTIAPGATADLTVVDLTHPHLQPLFDPRRGLVALGNRANIDQVIVDGRLLIDAGRYIHGDETAMVSTASAAIGKIWDLPEAQAAFNG